MTNKEAIERINGHIAIHRYSEPQAIHIAEALQMAISALEKQVLKKPEYEEEDSFIKNHFTTWHAYCPQCGCEINTGDMHCTQCGQAIDWSDET